MQKEVDLDTDGPARGSRTEGLGKTEGEACRTRGSKAHGEDLRTSWRSVSDTISHQPVRKKSAF